MCEILLVAWPEPQPFERVLPWALGVERLGVAGFGWGLAWRRDGRILHYCNEGRLSDDRAGRARLGAVASTHFLVHMRRPACLSTVGLPDTQPFVAEDRSFGFAHNGHLGVTPPLRRAFAPRLRGRADSEVGFQLVDSLLATGQPPELALAAMHRKMGGSANLAYLPAEGDPLAYAGNPLNPFWRFRLEGAEVASTGLHSGDDSLFSMCFGGASLRRSIADGESVTLRPLLVVSGQLAAAGN